MEGGNFLVFYHIILIIFLTHTTANVHPPVTQNFHTHPFNTVISVFRMHQTNFDLTIFINMINGPNCEKVYFTSCWGPGVL